jgi:hypothetical protein
MEIKTVPFGSIEQRKKCLIPPEEGHKFAGCVIQRLVEHALTLTLVDYLDYATRGDDSLDKKRVEDMYHNAIYEGETFKLAEDTPVVPVK